MLDQILSVDNIAIVVLAIWIGHLVKQNKEYKDENNKQWQIIDKINDTLRKMRYVLHADKTGRIDLNDLEN